LFFFFFFWCRFKKVKKKIAFDLDMELLDDIIDQKQKEFVPSAVLKCGGSRKTEREFLKALVKTHGHLIQIKYKECKDKEHLAMGGYSLVLKARYRGEWVALKRLFAESEAHHERVKLELELMSTLKHDNVVRMVGATIKNKQELFVVLDYMHGGALDQFLTKSRRRERSSGGTVRLSWSRRLHFAQQIARGMHFLHCNHVLHRDLKTDNVLLDASVDVCKISDFGLSLRVSSELLAAEEKERRRQEQEMGIVVEEEDDDDLESSGDNMDEQAAAPIGGDNNDEQATTGGAGGWSFPEHATRRRSAAVGDRSEVAKLRDRVDNDEGAKRRMSDARRGFGGHRSKATSSAAAAASSSSAAAASSPPPPPTLTQRPGLASQKSLRMLPRRLTVCGTEGMMAPELLLNAAYTEKVDIFAYGVVLYELITLERPPRRRVGRDYNFDVDHYVKRFVPDTPLVLVDLLRACTAYVPSKRPSFANIIEQLEPALAIIGSDDADSLPRLFSQFSTAESASGATDSKDDESLRRSSSSSRRRAQLGRTERRQFSRQRSRSVDVIRDSLDK
jgi:serine/threonine protein kinase